MIKKDKKWYNNFLYDTFISYGLHFGWLRVRYLNDINAPFSPFFSILKGRSAKSDVVLNPESPVNTISRKHAEVIITEEGVISISDLVRQYIEKSMDYIHVYIHMNIYIPTYAHTYIGRNDLMHIHR